jgi:hypothetical protein
LAILLDRTADRLEAKILREEWYINDVFERLVIVVMACCPDGLQQPIAVGLKTLLALSPRAEVLIVSLENEIGLQG